MAKDCHIEQPIVPLSGPMDTRSLPGSMAYGTWRWRQNFACVEKGKLCRRNGWTKLFDDLTPYQNQDLHDQLLDGMIYYDEADPPQDSATVQEYPPDSALCDTVQQEREGTRQPITFLFEAVSTDGSRRLLAGTQNQIYCARPSTGNWKIIADAYGGTAQANLPERRWQAAQVNDVVVFTNDYDPLLYWVFDQPTQGCAMQAVSTIPATDDIGLSRAGTVASWKGIMFFGDVEMDGQRVRHRVVWSDLNAPLSLSPDDDSIAGSQDLDYGEKVLRFMPLGDYLMIYTTRAIWQVAYVGGDQVLQFIRKYANDKGDLCLSFRNTLDAIGEDHFYASKDGIYRFNLFLTSPERVDWIHQASYYTFSTIDTNVCEAHVGRYDPISNEYWLSWVEVGRSFPRQTFAVNLNPETASSDYIDHGFTAMLPHSIDTRPDIDAFVRDNCICTQEELDSLDEDGSLQAPQKEGENCTAGDSTDCDEDTTTPAWTSVTTDLDGKTIEDYDQENPSEDSLCTFISGFDFDQICKDCNVTSRFVLASASDYCLKEVSDVGYREVCTSFGACGEYEEEGYDSILRTGAIRGKSDRDQLNMSRMEVVFSAEAQATPSNLDLRVGYSGVPIDPNNPECAIRWRELSSKPLRCASTTTTSEHESAATAPTDTIGWQFVFESRNLYFELSIEGVGGLSCFSSVVPFIAGRILPPQS